MGSRGSTKSAAAQLDAYWDRYSDKVKWNKAHIKDLIVKFVISIKILVRWGVKLAVNKRWSAIDINPMVIFVGILLICFSENIKQCFRGMYICNRGWEFIIDIGKTVIYVVVVVSMQHNKALIISVLIVLMYLFEDQQKPFFVPLHSFSNKHNNIIVSYICIWCLIYHWSCTAVQQLKIFDFTQEQFIRFNKMEGIRYVWDAKCALNLNLRLISIVYVSNNNILISFINILHWDIMIYIYNI